MTFVGMSTVLHLAQPFCNPAREVHCKWQRRAVRQSRRSWELKTLVTKGECATQRGRVTSLAEHRAVQQEFAYSELFSNCAKESAVTWRARAASTECGMVYCTQCKDEVETETDEAHGYTCVWALGSGSCIL